MGQYLVSLNASLLDGSLEQCYVRRTVSYENQTYIGYSIWQGKMYYRARTSSVIVQALTDQRHKSQMCSPGMLLLR